eukprot:347285-Chlamydomonas_euryale.AAC.1
MDGVEAAVVGRDGRCGGRGACGGMKISRMWVLGRSPDQMPRLEGSDGTCGAWVWGLGVEHEFLVRQHGR